MLYQKVVVVLFAMIMAPALCVPTTLTPAKTAHVAFEEADKNGDGVLSKEEFNGYMGIGNMGPSDDDEEQKTVGRAEVGEEARAKSPADS